MSPPNTDGRTWALGFAVGYGLASLRAGGRRRALLAGFLVGVLLAAVTGRRDDTPRAPQPAGDDATTIPVHVGE
jgi:hypothetical protein